MRYLLYGFILSLLLIDCQLFAQDNPAESKWVRIGQRGKLEYGVTAKGDRVPDFSHAGYNGGGVAIPDVPAMITLNPSGREVDQSDEIQKAIDQVSGMAEKEGIRGAVLLLPGIYYCSKPIVLHTSGVVVRGSGTSAGGTTIQMTGEKHAAFVIGQPRGRRESGNEREEEIRDLSESGASEETYITDRYVPAGTNTFSVESAEGFDAGDRIAIYKPVTASWIQFMQMDILKRDGKKQRWISEGSAIVHYGTIVRIDGNQITVEVPLTDSFDSQFLDLPGVKVAKVAPRSEVTNGGVENLRVQCPPLEIHFGNAPYSGVFLQGDHCWVRDVWFQETMNTIRISGNYNTIQRVRVSHTYPNLGASKPADFSFNGNYNLVDRCEAIGGNTYFVWTGSRITGPNVLLNSTFHGHGNRIQPHQRWSTGLLVDNCTIVDGGIDFLNRGVAGSGHGWTMGWAVAWNCIAKFYTIQNPPGTKNWAIGCIGDIWRTPALFNTAPLMPDGEFDSHQNPVTPQSLYLAQLSERLGAEALHAIGYTSNSLAEFSNKNEQPVAPLIRIMDPELGVDLSAFMPINADNERDDSRMYAAEKAVDSNPATYWATENGIVNSSITIDTEGPIRINAVRLDEAKIAGARVLEYKLEAQVDSDWVLLSRGGEIGERKIDRFPELTVWKVRLTILRADRYAAISHFGLYLEEQ